MADLEQQVMQLTQDLYVLKHTVIAGKTVEERIKESNTVLEDVMIKGEDEKYKSHKMEKLIGLLNEYTGKERVLDSDMGEDWFFLKGDCLNQIREVKLISKKYGFIKWLVDNDKIDINGYLHYNVGLPYESLLMALSIEDNPIEFLVSILK